VVEKKKKGNTALYLAGNIVSLAVVMAFLSHAFDQNIEHMTVALLALLLGFAGMKLTDYIF
jgi:hypothetical protein